MKRAFLFILFLLGALNLVSPSIFGRKTGVEFYDSIIEKEEEEVKVGVQNKMYHEFISQTIPSKFVDIFYDFTYERKSLGIELLGIGFWESDWRVFVGPVNPNGTYDKGPLMLNETNLKSKWFMKTFAYNCSEYSYDEDIYYMTICINFWAALRKEYNFFDALQAYNGGPKVHRPTVSVELKNTVLRYARSVLRHHKRVEDKWLSLQNDLYHTSVVEVEKNLQVKMERREREMISVAYSVSTIPSEPVVRRNGLFAEPLFFKRIRIKTIIDFNSNKDLRQETYEIKFA